MASSLVALSRNLAPSVISALNLGRGCKLLQVQSLRFLYSKTTLGLDTFTAQTQRARSSLGNISEKFKIKMREYSGDDSQNMIFTEDLKNMIYIAESDEDVNLVIKMMKKFNQQNKELRFGSFVFGTVVMRMFHTLNKPNEALDCFKSPELQGFFDQLMTYQLLFDLLFENQKYQEILDTLPLIISKQVEGMKYPKNIAVLTLAACYKLNTPESFKYATDLWNDFREVGHVPLRRAVTFYAGLAYNTGNYAAALEITSSHKSQSYITIRNLKVAALAKLDRVEDALPILKSIIREDVPQTVGKHTFSNEVMEIVKEAVEKSPNSDIKLEFNRIEKLFKEEGHIVNESLDKQLCQEIATIPFVRSKNQPFRFNKYQNFNDRTVNKRQDQHRRPGLSELQ